MRISDWSSDVCSSDLAKGTRNLLALAVDAARKRATLGEISQAMEDAFGRYDTVPKPVKGVYGGAYANDDRWTRVVDGVDACERRKGRKPSMLGAQMGQDGPDRGTNDLAWAFTEMGVEAVRVEGVGVGKGEGVGV